MYTVVVVDDEPTSLSHICTIIETKCSEFKIIGMAEDGKSGLEEVRKKHPDILISDVKMPLLNGIELTSLVKKEVPECMSIIVSGYQDFEYVKGAIQSEVCDYLLKPITPSKLKAVLESVKNKLEQVYYEGRNRLVQKICRGGSTDAKTLHKYFEAESYYAALIRKNGLPRRFFCGTGIEIFSDIHEQMFIYGRDEMEALYILPETILFNKDFESIVQEILNKEKKEQQYLTTILVKEAFGVAELPTIMKSLYRALDTKSIVGVNQILFLEDIEKHTGKEFKQISKEENLKKIEYLIKESQYEKFREEIKHLFFDWQRQKRPQLWVEGMARQILYLIQKYHNDTGFDSKCEFMLDDAFFYASSLEELLESLYFIFNKNLKEDAGSLGKVDTPEFIKIIKAYLDKNISEQITLQTVCKKFGVSQTYLSKMFRKYENTSFNNYLTNIRVEKAKELMQQDKTLFIKDITSMVGYKDQFYFSRIFRSITGKCPSEYIDCM
ncbi:MAG: response regulator [Clostridia bacterium]|jgi:YesN/AraC family two-component response regulator|nr:response regulator [Clostridia bacterium]